MDVARLSVSRPPDNLPEQVEHLKWVNKALQGEIYSIQTEIQMRPALSCGCLCFVLVGCPVGIWFSRSDYLSSFITSFLPIVVVYYPLLLCATGLARGEGKPFVVPLIWGADAVVGAVGLALLWRLVRS